MAKKTAFLTGASGNMGWASFQEIYNNRPDLDLVVLLRDSEKNRKKFAPYLGDKRVRIVWGDLTNYDSVLECVVGSDYVLHIGGMVSPSADYYPKKCLKTNLTAAQNIVKAIKAQPNKDEITACYIGTVAETGNRPEPIHWARTGDPLKVSVYDHYAISKINAERVFAESGLKKWVSLRQSGILYANILKNMDPIMFHVPLNGVLEWATIDDSATLMERICNDNIPDEFYRNFYNIGSGDQYRLTNYEFECYLLGAIGMCKDAPKKVFEPNWFIDRNFHGQWYADSDLLEHYLHFRHNIPVKEYFKKLATQVEWFYKLAWVATLPGISHITKFALGQIAKDKRFGTRTWIKTNNTERMNAYWGDTESFGMEHWKKIPSKWADTDIHVPSKTPTNLDHGYDESKKLEDLTAAEIQKAAEFRGGEYLESKKPADIYAPVKWRCAFGHEFEMSLNTVLKGGHWCPECNPMPWNYDAIAKKNPFFAQVWYADHGKNEDYVHTEEIYRDYDEYKKK